MKLYFKFFSMHLKSRMAYRKSFFFSIIGQFLTSFTSFLWVLFLFARFNEVRGYTIGECLLCAGTVNMSFALAEMFFRGFDSMQNVIRSAQFDRLLLRPRGLIFQMICHMIEFGRIGKILQALLMLVYGAFHSPVVWTPYRIGVLLLMIFSGTTLFCALFLLHAAVCFFTIEGIEFLNIFTYGAREYGAYPLDVYGSAILKFSTYLIPYALVQFYPLLYLLGRTSNPAYALVSLLAPLFFLPCYALWRFGIRRYTSVGS